MTRPHFYILDEGHALIATDDVVRWGRWFEDADRRRVAWTEIGDVYVSTVFLGIDHRFFGDGPPLVFETMVFETKESVSRMPFTGREFTLHKSRDDDGFFGRCSTWDEALAQHERICACVRAGLS